MWLFDDQIICKQMRVLLYLKLAEFPFIDSSRFRVHFQLGFTDLLLPMCKWGDHDPHDLPIVYSSSDAVGKWF